MYGALAVAYAVPYVFMLWTRALSWRILLLTWGLGILHTQLLKSEINRRLAALSGASHSESRSCALGSRSEEVALEAELNDTATAAKIGAALPIRTSFNTWGDEIYFSIPVDAELDDSAQEVVEIGDLGYWPPGSAPSASSSG